MKKVLVLCAIGLFTVSAIAQNKPAAKKAAPKKQQQAMPAMPTVKPSPEMQKLANALSGKWTAVTKMEAMGNMPAGEAKGSATFFRGPGGLSLIEEFRSVGGGMGSFTGHGITYWDNTAKNFTGLWCDSMSPNGCSSGGTSKWEDDKVVGFMEMPDPSGNMQKYRMTYSDIKPGSVTFTMEAPDGDNYKPMMTIVYTRAAAAPAAPAAKKD
jgi:hypothetical protein